MRGNILNKALILCCLLAMAGCKAKKLIVDGPKPAAHITKPKNELEEKLNTIRGQQVVFNTFAARARTNLNINGNTNDCTLNIRIARDQQIWVSITALLGIEIARAKITPDSIFVVNKLQGIYIKKSFSYIHTFTNRQVNYAMLQALLVGNAVPSLLNDSTKYIADNTGITLNGNLKDIVYKLMLGMDLKVTQTNLSNAAQVQSLQINDGTYVASGSQKVPSQIDITSTAKDKKIQISMRYTKVDIDVQQDYPFSIPDGYSQGD